MSNASTPHHRMSYARRARSRESEKRLLVAAVYQPILSVAAARHAARDIETRLLWIDEHQASRFHEVGWEELLPHRQGAALFINRLRESTSVPPPEPLRKPEDPH